MIGKYKLTNYQIVKCLFFQASEKLSAKSPSLDYAINKNIKDDTKICFKSYKKIMRIIFKLFYLVTFCNRTNKLSVNYQNNYTFYTYLILMFKFKVQGTKNFLVMIVIPISIHRLFSILLAPFYMTVNHP